MRLAKAQVLALLVAAGFVAACSDPMAPSLPGTYTLSTLKGEPVPYDDPAGCCIYLSGRLDLTDTNYAISITFVGKISQQLGVVSETGTYDRAGAALLFTRSAGDIEFNLYDARFTDGGITLFWGGDGPGAADQFHAVFAR